MCKLIKHTVEYESTLLLVGSSDDPFISDTQIKQSKNCHCFTVIPNWVKLLNWWILYFNLFRFEGLPTTDVKRRLWPRFPDCAIYITFLAISSFNFSIGYLNWDPIFFPTLLLSLLICALLILVCYFELYNLQFKQNIKP